MTSKFTRLAAASVALAAIVAAAGLAPAAAQPVPEDLTTMPPVPTNFDPPRTPWGDPDFRGTWPIDNIASLFLQRSPQHGNRFWLTEEEYQQRLAQANRSDESYQAEDEAGRIGMGHWVESDASGRRTSLLIDPPDGRLPAFTEYGKNMMAIGRSSWVAGQTYDWTTDFDNWDRCITRAFPASMLPFRYNNGIRVYQAPGFVVIDLEMIHDSRIIPIVKKGEVKHNDPRVKEWMGDSVGYWDGNTLVIETDNIMPGGSPLNMATMGAPPNNVIPTSDEAHATERLTMQDPNHIIYEITYSDPKVWTKPWTARLEWTRNEDYEFFEYACHEGNVQVRNYITSSRALRGTDAAMKESDESAAN